MRASSWASWRRRLLVALVELAQQVELAALLGQRQRRVADVLDELVHLRVARVDVGALVGAGQEGRLPVLRLLDGIAARTHGDEAGQVLVVAAQAVGHPRTHARPDLPGLAAVHEQQRRLVIGHVGVHGADDADVVDAASRVREQVADLDADFAVPLKAEGRGEGGAGLRSVRRLVRGSSLPAYVCSDGLGSNESTCEGPPFMNRWMTRLARAGKCGPLGASGDTARPESVAAARP